MTEKELDALEAAAKAATPGPWKCPGRALVVSRMDSSEQLVCDCLSKQFAQAPKDAAFIAAANPAAVLDLIAELRQAKEECLHHKDYIAELEQSSLVYDKRLADISKLLDIEHEDGSYAELSYIYNSVVRLQGELRQARAERDWLAEKNQDAPCELGMECLHPDSIPKNKNRICDPAECWRELAAKEATCLRI